MALLDGRRRALQTEALAIGRRVYAEKPTDFARRVHSYWKAWRDERADEYHSANDQLVRHVRLLVAPSRQAG